MKTILIIFAYFKWHYGKAILSLSNIWKNFLYFIFHYFSIGLLFKNFFDPWKRMADSYPKSFNFKEYLFSFLTNMIVRIVGMIMRSFMIIIGLTCYIILAIFYPVAVIIWLLLPFITLYLIATGLLFIIS